MDDMGDVMVGVSEVPVLEVDLHLDVLVLGHLFDEATWAGVYSVEVVLYPV